MSNDLPEVPPPPAPRPPMKRSTVVLAGCGLGCGVLVVVGLCLMIGLSLMIPSLLQPRARTVVEDIYEKAQENKNLTKQQLAVYAELYAVNESPMVSGLVTITSAAIFHDHLRDGALTDEEIAEATVLRDFLNDHPNAGMIDMMRFYSDHPEFKDKVNAFQSNPANLRPS